MTLHGATSFFTMTEAQQQSMEVQNRCRAAAIKSKRQLIFSHLTALQLHGLRAVMRTSLDTAALHITVDSDTKKSHITGITEHCWHGEMTHSFVDDLILAVSVEQAICQIARFTDLDSLVIAMDWLTCHHPQLRQTTHQRLSDYIHGLGRFTGAPRCRAALKLSMDGTDSPQETVLRLKLLEHGLRAPTVNHPIFDEADGSTMRVDMAYAPERVAIEYDGEYHYDKQRWRYDAFKRNRLQDLHWRVLVATKQDMRSSYHIDRFIRMVIHAIHDARDQGAHA